MRRTAHQPVLAAALVVLLAVSSSCSSDDDPGSDPSPSTTRLRTSAGLSTSPSASLDAAGPDEVAALLGRNLEAYKLATGSYPKGGSQAYLTVVNIDQAQGYAIAYSVDRAGRMVVCVSDDAGSASYDSKDRAVTDGDAQGCGV